MLEIVNDWIPHILYTLAYLAGLVLAIILLVKSKAKAAILAAVAFGLLLVRHVIAWWFSIPLHRFIYDVIDPDPAQWVVGAFNCCCSLIQLAAIICLIIAIWQAVSPSIPKEV
jgi:hypothetical protein